MQTSPASSGRKAVMAILATIPPALVAAGIGFGAQYWSAHSGAPLNQRALMTTEPARARGSLEINGTVTWRAVDGNKGTSMVADLIIAVEGTHIVLTFSKNTDQTLPASHLIEVATSVLPGSRAGPVAKIGDLVAKSSPDADGTPLAGDVVDVTDSLFWIALSRLSVDRFNNLRLLAASPFFALPVTYASGVRANIVFEKGRSGDAVAEKVLTAWGP